MDLTGQVALVTGAGRGLGRAFARALAAAGARVGITSRSADELQAALADLPEEQLGPVALLVNNAKQFRAFAVGGVDPAEWWREVEVNLRMWQDRHRAARHLRLGG